MAKRTTVQLSSHLKSGREGVQIFADISERLFAAPDVICSAWFPSCDVCGNPLNLCGAQGVESFP